MTVVARSRLVRGQGGAHPGGPQADAHVAIVIPLRTIHLAAGANASSTDVIDGTPIAVIAGHALVGRLRDAPAGGWIADTGHAHAVQV